ncbi:MAG TPA: DUF1553 domain-containing protein [Planctomycetes bacterium]|nr:DUF1553 domain-containing protein [Planctomycetota bacterium]
MSTIVAEAPAQDVQYNRDVRPILADKCFRCHGPDAAARESQLRLDDRQNATKDRSGHRVIEPGNPAASELIGRVASLDDDERMPPVDSGLTLSSEEIEILRQWIKNGAEYQQHWSFIPPRRPSLPSVKHEAWPMNPIDRFVLNNLERHGLDPSGAADNATLIRRVTLDLTGLPPTLKEIDAFERDSSDDHEAAYQNLVDRLLASPRYGERMAPGWLDAARYADTNGYFTDNDRTMWLWRDWVIDAFNSNMPFDRFTIEQLAGDLLPESTMEQKIATGFNRNHMVNNETGIIEEEFRVEYVVDRVDTTATVWMGLTVGCARCHDHKYDPISQKDFYRFFSFFNNVPERGLSGSSGNAAPLLKAPTPEQQGRLDQLPGQIAAAQQEFAAIQKELDDAQSTWETTAVAGLPRAGTAGLVAHFALDDELADESVTGSVSIVDGMLGKAAKFDGAACISIANGVDFDHGDAFSFGAWIRPEAAGCVISKMNDAQDMRGFDVTLRKGKAIVNLVHRWNRNAIRISTASSLAMRQWQHLMVCYDGSGKAAGAKIYLDGQPQPVEVAQDTLTGTIRNQQPLRIGRRQASASYTGLIDDVRFYDRQLSADDVHRLATEQLVRGIVTRPPEKRSDIQQRKLRTWFLQNYADKRFSNAATKLEELRAEQRQVLQNVASTMVMQEADKPRPAFLLLRGEYDQHGEEVAAGVPAFLAAGRTENSPPRNKDGSAIRSVNRLDLAQWLVAPSHPLTARVTVNRLWQLLFGTGIVRTVDDFGTQGAWPSHPKLLDWLAIELIDSGWDMKHLLRVIVRSATYRQSSNCSAQLHSRDPDNRLLARGSRFRMDAEMLRDNALAISGLLVEKRGGPSVKPYQPAGLWRDVTYDSDRAYQPDSGAALYRRSLYTFWKRQSPPPNMRVFDAPTRETCTVQRSRTNTPLQALALMNDPTFVEASRTLAERLMTEAPGDPSKQIIVAFRTATARRPTAYEVDVLRDVFEVQKNVFATMQSEALKLLSVGDSKRNDALNVAEHAAWTVVTSMILSLDETITRR